MAEKEHRENVLDALKEYEHSMKEVETEVEKHFTMLLNAHLDYFSTDESFDAVAGKLNAEQESAFRKDLKLRKAIMKNLSKDEWNVLLPKSDKGG